MEKKITSLRAVMQERVKALREKQAVKPAVSAEKKPLMQSRMKELMERAKLARGEQGSTVPVSFKEMMLKRSTMFRNIINKNNKEVSHD